MLRVYILTFLGVVSFNKVADAQCVDSIMSKIFFSANLSKRDTSLINFFKTNSKLGSVDDSNYVKIRVINELDTGKNYYKYRFTSLPVSNYKIAKGELTIVASKNKQNDSVVVLELKIGFVSRKSRDSFCKEMATLFKKCSLDEFEPIGNAPSEFYVGVYRKRDERAIIIAETPLEFYQGALILFYFENW